MVYSWGQVGRPWLPGSDHRGFLCFRNYEKLKTGSHSLNDQCADSVFSGLQGQKQAISQSPLWSSLSPPHQYLDMQRHCCFSGSCLLRALHHGQDDSGLYNPQQQQEEENSLSYAPVQL